MKHMGFAYDVEVVLPSGIVIREPRAYNLIPIEGLNHMLGVTLHGESQFPSWYIAPYEGNYTPVPTVTAASFAGDAIECTAYEESTRVEFTESAPAGGSMNNNTSPSIFTLTAPKTIYGFGMLSASAKGAVSGKVLSVVRLPSPRQYDAGAVMKVTANPYIQSIS